MLVEQEIVTCRTRNKRTPNKRQILVEQEIVTCRTRGERMPHKKQLHGACKAPCMLHARVHACSIRFLHNGQYENKQLRRAKKALRITKRGIPMVRLASFFSSLVPLWEGMGLSIVDKRADVLTVHHATQVAQDVHIEDVDGQVVLHTHGCGCNVHDLQTA